jgi:SAM-dependent methyltransferase
VTTTAAQAWVADLYDAYVTSTRDIPFFVDEARRTFGPVLELMSGTGRISLPLARMRIDLTCVDLSGPMLARLRGKLDAEGLSATLHEANVTTMLLPDRSYALALLPFQSFGELIDMADQRASLQRVAEHLTPGGRFICTLHNPNARVAGVDGQLRLLGTFPLHDTSGTLALWAVQQREADTSIVRAVQFYELYDAEGRLTAKRMLDVRFRLIGQTDFQEMAQAAGFVVDDLYGDYDRTPFDEAESPYMIWMLTRAGTTRPSA